MNTPLDTTTFENWMRQIMERFDRNEQLIASLTGKELREVKYLDGERLLDNQDLCELLNTSKRSIQRYRSSGTLKYQMPDALAQGVLQGIGRAGVSENPFQRV